MLLLRAMKERLLRRKGCLSYLTNIGADSKPCTGIHFLIYPDCPFLLFSVTATSPPETIRTLICSPTSGNIRLVLIGGEQQTYIRDGTPANTAISGYENRHPLAVTLFGDTVYLVRILLNCPSIYGGDSLATDCYLAHHVDVSIDLNDDGKFDQSENQVHRRTPIDSESLEHGYDLQIIIPVIDGTYTKAGPHRMRLTLMRSEAYRRECNDAGYSETRHYIVNIIPRKTCPGRIRKLADCCISNRS